MSVVVDLQLFEQGIGIVAALLVFSTFYMRTMQRLRMVAILSNVAFAAYGLLLHLWPLLVLHCALFPLNIWRLVQMRRTLRDLKSARSGGFDLTALMSHFRLETHPAGTVLFSRGDVADKAYYIARGEIALPDIPAELGEGDFLGEVGLFTSLRQRTSAALCKTDVALYSLDEEAISTAFFQHPSFAFHLVSLISVRLLANQALRTAAPAERDGEAIESQRRIAGTV